MLRMKFTSSTLVITIWPCAVCDRLRVYNTEQEIWSLLPGNLKFNKENGHFKSNFNKQWCCDAGNMK